MSVDADEAAAPPSMAGAAAADQNKSNIATILIAIVASIGGVFIIWTIFRKWKLRPSSSFDDRMQPIDWQPAGPDDSGLPNHRRANSAASHGSFHSSGHGHEAGSGYGATSNHGHGGLDPLPDHDFTAAAGGNLAPVGGYADLQRGPSPQPTMAELNRGPSFNQHQYGYGQNVRY